MIYNLEKFTRSPSKRTLLETSPLKAMEPTALGPQDDHETIFVWHECLNKHYGPNGDGNQMNDEETL